jgi:biopolymer transport protein ExbB
MFSCLPPPCLAFAPWDLLVGFFETGGPFMVPLALCGIWAAVVTIQRLLALRRELVMPRFLRAAIEKLPAGTDTGHLWQLAERSHAALAQITLAALRHLAFPKDENAAAVQTAARRELMRLSRGLSVLELIVGISPLLGLLGAISGLVGVFSNLAATGEEVSNTAGVAVGIAEALNTTIFGLAIAIPTLIVYTFLNRRVERLAVEMETLIASLLTKCYVEDPATAGRP